MAPKTAVFERYLGSDSLRQHVLGEIKQMINSQIRPAGPYGQKRWSIRHMIKKMAITGKSHSHQKILVIRVYRYLYFVAPSKVI